MSHRLWIRGRAMERERDKGGRRKKGEALALGWGRAYKAGGQRGSDVLRVGLGFGGGGG